MQPRRVQNDTRMTYTVLGDWGTSRLRLYRMEQGRCIAQREGPGIGGLADVSATLSGALKPWLAEAPPSAITLCGMVGSRNGLVEVGYADCPADIAKWAQAAHHMDFEGIPLTIAAGLACTDADGRPDVMRGEETQVFGAVALNPSSKPQAFLLPGTHSKFAQVTDVRITQFRTFFTGELFALLRNQSTLFAAGGAQDTGDDSSGFAAGLARAQTTGLMGSLFEARAAQLRQGHSIDWAHGFVSGLLIGHEIGELKTRVPQGNIAVIGAPALSARYKTALTTLGLPCTLLDAEACTLRGLELLNDHC